MRRLFGKFHWMGSKALLPVAFFMLVYVAVVLFLMPLRVVLQQIELPPGLQLSGTDDSIWSGEIDQVLLGGRDMGRMQYSARPWRLLFGRVEYALSLQAADKQMHAVVGRALWSDSLHVEAMQGTIDFIAFKPVIPKPFQAGGELSLAVDSLVWDAQGLLSANGQLQWLNASAGLQQAVRLGNITGDLSDDGQDLRLAIGSQQGELVIGGDVSLSSQGMLNVQLQLLPGEEVSGAGRQLLSFTGSADEGGRFEYNGKLF